MLREDASRALPQELVRSAVEGAVHSELASQAETRPGGATPATWPSTCSVCPWDQNRSVEASQRLKFPGPKPLVRRWRTKTDIV